MSGISALDYSLSVDLVNFGHYKICGFAYRDLIPGAYKIWLCKMAPLRPIRTTISASDGSYCFYYLPYLYKGYAAIVFDHNDPPKSHFIQSHITPTAM